MKAVVHVTHLNPIEAESGRFNAIIETPKGSRNKFKYDEKLDLFKLDKVLPLGASFPFDFGFIPGTRGEDGDPLDVLVLMDEPAFPGCLVTGRLIGVIEAEQTEKGETLRNDRLILSVETHRNPAEVTSLDQLNPNRLDEIEHFFVSYNIMEGREFKPIGRKGPEQAVKLVEKGTKQFGSPEKDRGNGNAARRGKSQEKVKPSPAGG
jgi:inorganic pyrophosphatase